MNYQLKIKEIHIKGNKFHFVVEGTFEEISRMSKPKVVMHFFNGIEDRRIPLVIGKVEHDEQKKTVYFCSDYRYDLDRIFWKSRNLREDMEMYFNLLYGDSYEEKIAVDMTPEEMRVDGKNFDCQIMENHLLFQYKARKKGKKKKKPFLKISKVRKRRRSLCKKGRKLIRWAKSVGVRETIHRLHRIYNKHYYKNIYKKIKQNTEVLPNRVSFVSFRRTEISGNFQFVYDQVKDDPSLDIQVFLTTKDRVDMKKKELRQLATLFASSKLILLDEFSPLIHYIDLPKETRVMQLWHACGAFKTFGFTRLGKPSGSKQATKIHRNYDYVTVSSEQIRMCYAEGFGVPTENVVATGIPRTDVFFDERYKENTRQRLYQQYPMLKEKKVVLFAPTFRGHVRENAFYPMDKFDVEQFMEEIGDEYVLIIKHHPFVQEKHPIPEKYRDRVMDLSEDTEVNDLLFITDIIITDYSSLVFEASLLNIPMLFYAYDLEQYIAERDFYFDYETFVPGYFFYTQKELQEAIIHHNLGEEKLEAFKHKFFDDFDGKSTKRVVDLLYQALERQQID